MSRRYAHLTGVVILVSALLILVSCAKRGTGPGEEAGPGARGKVTEETIPGRPEFREAPVGPTSREAESPLADVYFDFDKSILRPDAKEALNKDIQWLKANPRARIQVEGHCDERGTNEYNLALGDVRAKTVRDYLVAGGVSAARITIISYGEERPFNSGHDEEAWKWNRRVHFVIVSK